MAEAKDAYRLAMREASNAAWEHDWPTAIRAYQAALQAAPNDSQALAGLGFALVEANRIEEALAVYQKVSQIVPNDPIARERMGYILEMLDRTGEAARQYFAVAEIYFARKDVHRALPNWERAARLAPELMQAHQRLAAIYDQGGDAPRASREYLMIAILFQRHNDLQKAHQALRRALALDATSTEVREALDDLRQGRPIRPPAMLQEKSAAITQHGVDMSEFEEDEEKKRSPIDEAAELAMGILAEAVFSDEFPMDAAPFIIKGTEQHRVGDVENAIANYEAALNAGHSHPALLLCLGLLYQQSRNTQKAIDILPGVMNERPEYAIAGHLALGQAYFVEDRALEAAQHLIEAIRQADRLLSDQVDEGGYERLLDGITLQSAEQLADDIRAKVAYLSDRDWRSKLARTLNGFIAQGKDNYVPDLMELIIEGGRPEIASVMQTIDSYLMRNMLHMALDETHYALEKSPDYLPAHVRVTDILVKEGRTQDAADKLRIIADTYLIRGNADKAADLFAKVLEVWPADLDARVRLIRMLKSQGRVNEAIRHYSELADAQRDILLQEEAKATYLKALEYGRANHADAPLLVAILKELADLESSRLDWRQALTYYQQVVELAPDDEDATLEMINLQFQLGQEQQAVAALDSYMRYCITSGRVDRVLPTLEDQVRTRPDQMALRQRLAEVYLQQKRLPEAVAQLDALGEMQLEAGLQDAAIKTIRRIIALNPADIEGYRRLLAQLEGAGSG